MCKELWEDRIWDNSWEDIVEERVLEESRKVDVDSFGVWLS